MTHPRTAWLAFALLGALDGLLLLELPVGGVVLMLLALIGITVRPPRGASVAGLVFGIGGAWTGLLLRVKVSCDAFNQAPGQSCEAPGIDRWILIGVTILFVGSIATLAVVVRERRAAGMR